MTVLAPDLTYFGVSDSAVRPKKARRATSPQSPTYKFARSLMAVGNPLYRRGLVDAITHPLSALAEDTSESTTLILTDRRQVCLYSLYRLVTGAPQLNNDHRVLSSLFLRLSSKARWASSPLDRVRAILSDDTRVKSKNGTLVRLARTAETCSYLVNRFDHDRKKSEVSDPFDWIDWSQSEGDVYWGIDFRPLSTKPDTLTLELAELNTAISRALAQYDIPRVTNHLVSRSVKLPLRCFNEIFSRPDMTVTDVTHASLAEGNCRSYTLLPKEDLRSEWRADFGSLASSVRTAKIRLFTRLDGDSVHVRVAPVVIADLSSSDLEKTLTTLGLDLGSDEREELRTANGKGTTFLGSLGVEAHQLACYLLGALFFAQARKTIQGLWGITELDRDDEFATLVLGLELKDLVDRLLEKSSQASKTMSDQDVPEGRKAQQPVVATKGPRPTKDVHIYSISNDVMEAIRSFLKNQDGPVTVADLVVELNKNESLARNGDWNYASVSLALDTLCAGGNISPTTVYDKKTKLLVNAYCTGESSGDVPHRARGYGLGITRRDRRPPLDARDQDGPETVIES